MMKGAVCIKKGILLSFLLLASVLTGCVQLSDAEQDAQENAYLAQQLFVADFDCNYDLLYQLAEDVLASGSDLSGVQGEIHLLNDTSAKLFFSYHLRVYTVHLRRSCISFRLHKELHRAQVHPPDIFAQNAFLCKQTAYFLQHLLN